MSKPFTALQLRKELALHGEKEVFFTPPGADFSRPVLTACSSMAMNYGAHEQDATLKYYSNIAGVTTCPEYISISGEQYRMHGLKLKDLCQYLADAKTRPMYVRHNRGEEMCYVVTGYEIHDDNDWVELHG